MFSITAKGSPEQIGYQIGSKLAKQIENNIFICDKEIKYGIFEEEQMIAYIKSYKERIDSYTLRMVKGLSIGSNIPISDILRYNAIGGMIYPEECTTFAAIGKSTKDGKPILLKNRDTNGSKKFIGPEYYNNREINILVATETLDGNTIIGITKAGSCGLMMGMNKYGVAAASNFGQLAEVAHFSPVNRGTSGRPQILREGLQCTSAAEATNQALTRLVKNPMALPGIIFFMDANNIFVIEGSSADNLFAVQHITDGIVYRSNHFQLLNHLNNEEAVSAICREKRAKELINQNYGKINRDKLKEFSMDHKHGPGDNSICRHNNDPEAGVTVSAAIMEINVDEPQKSTIDIAIGSPCWAWRKKDGHLTVRMDEDITKISKSFLDGDVFKYYLRPNAYSV